MLKKDALTQQPIVNLPYRLNPFQWRFRSVLQRTIAFDIKRKLLSSPKDPKNHRHSSAERETDRKTEVCDEKKTAKDGKEDAQMTPRRSRI
ncbi:hypothetical protein JTB14_021079 [Gonioctena quinquepunctata]|nr:hypothetical protein JTB14_021079 [Gonioctena quinquepunctata]